jgi:hypothetical protein
VAASRSTGATNRARARSGGTANAGAPGRKARTAPPRVQERGIRRPQLARQGREDDGHEQQAEDRFEFTHGRRETSRHIIRRRGAALLRGDVLDPADQIEVLLEVLALEAWRVPAVVVRGQVLEALEAAGQEPAPERAVGAPINSLRTAPESLKLGVWSKADASRKCLLGPALDYPRSILVVVEVNVSHHHARRYQGLRGVASTGRFMRHLRERSSRGPIPSAGDATTGHWSEDSSALLTMA